MHRTSLLLRSRRGNSGVSVVAIIAIIVLVLIGIYFIVHSRSAAPTSNAPSVNVQLPGTSSGTSGGTGGYTP